MNRGRRSTRSNVSWTRSSASCREPQRPYAARYRRATWEPSDSGSSGRVASCTAPSSLTNSGSRCVTALTSRLLPVSSIGVLREGPLHAAIKATLAAPGDRFEVPIDGFVIDLVRADGELVEVQTGGFSALGRKLDALLDAHRFRIVYPVAAGRRIVRVDRDGEVASVRRSPRRAGV